MKKLLSFVFILALLAGMRLVVSASEEVSVSVNGKVLESDESPIIVDGRTLVPLRALCEALGCEVTWDDISKSTQVKNEIMVVEVYVDNLAVTKYNRRNYADSEYINLEAAPCIIGERTYVPIRSFSEVLNALVGWNSQKRRVDVTMEFDFVGDLDENNLAEVKKDGKYGYVNEKHKVIIPVIYDRIDAFSEGLAPAMIDNKWGYINTAGKVDIPLIYGWTYVFEDGLGMIYKDGKFGIINSSGKVIASRVYDSIGKFVNGLACVEKDGKYGYINKSGKEVVSVIYDDIGAYSEGLAPICKNGKWGYVNTEGKVVISMMYNAAYDFSKGQALVIYGEDRFFITAKGQRIN